MHKLVLCVGFFVSFVILWYNNIMKITYVVYDEHLSKQYITPLFDEAPVYLSLDEFIEKVDTIAQDACNVIALGLEVFQAIMSLDAAQAPAVGKVKLGAIRGFTFWIFDHVRVVPTWSVNQLFFKPDLYLDICEDVSNTISLEPDRRIVSTKLVSSLTHLEALYKHLERLPHSTPICIDLETTGLNPLRDKLLCFALGLNDTSAFILTPELCNDSIAVVTIRKLLQLPLRWTFHNGKFDIRFLQQSAIAYAPVIVEDTMILHYVLDERVGTHGLKELVRRKLGVDDYDSFIKQYVPNKKASYSNIPKELLYKYAGYDVCYTLRLLKVLQAELDEQIKLSPKLKDIYAFMMRIQNGLASIESNGLFVDQQSLQELDCKLKENIDQLEIELHKIVGFDLNPRSFKQISHYLFMSRGLRQPLTWKGKDGSTNNKILEQMLLEVCPDDPFITTLMDYRKVYKIWSTYVTKVKSKIDSDGRLRTNFKPHGSVTGRLSGDSPNLMNIPRKGKNVYSKLIRSLFIAEEGNVLIGADYKSAELRALAEITQDEYLLEVFKQSRDLHSEMASFLYGDGWTSENRTAAKTLIFSIIYGKSSSGIAYELQISEDEGKELLNNFLARMPKVLRWLKSTRELAAKQGYLVAPNGRVRRFGLVNATNRWQVDTQSTNFSIQAEASDNCVEASLLMDTWGKYTGLCKVLLIVHDNIIVECKEENAQLISDKLQEIMLDAAYIRMGKNSVPFTTDVKVAHSWGDM